jgi:hypothetical protein
MESCQAKLSMVRVNSGPAAPTTLDLGSTFRELPRVAAGLSNGIFQEITDRQLLGSHRLCEASVTRRKNILERRDVRRDFIATAGAAGAVSHVARQIGIPIPQSILAQATLVIDYDIRVPKLRAPLTNAFIRIGGALSRPASSRCSSS